MNNSGIITIVINDEPITLRFGIPATRMFLEKVAEQGESMILGDTVNEIGISHLIYSGYVNNCMVTDEPIIKRPGYFLEFVEQAYVDEKVLQQLEDVSACYANSKYSQKMREKVLNYVEQSKKK